jgi:hypothetical protein
MEELRALADDKNIRDARKVYQFARGIYRLTDGLITPLQSPITQSIDSSCAAGNAPAVDELLNSD